MPLHRRVTPSIKFDGTHLNTWVETGTVRIKCPALEGPAQEHNTMPLSRAQTRTVRSGICPPAAHRCYNNCIKQMPKHWWASGGHFRGVNNYFLKHLNLKFMGLLLKNDYCSLFFNRILSSISSFKFLVSVKKWWKQIQDHLKFWKI